MSESYFQLNLLKWRENNRFRRFKRTLSILLISLMSSVLIGLVLNVYLNFSEQALARSMVTMLIDKSALDMQLSQVSKLIKDIKQYENLSKQYARQQDDNRQLFIGINEMTQLLPVNSWLTKLSYQTNQWRFEGRSEQTAEVEAFIAALRNTSIFNRISLERIEHIEHIKQIEQIEQIEQKWYPTEKASLFSFVFAESAPQSK